MSQVLKGKNAIITGASRGLGLEIATLYVKAGANVLICARDETQLDIALTSLIELSVIGQVVESITADVSKPADSKMIIAHACSIFPSVDILVNNAGVYGPKGFAEDLDWEQWKHTIEVNLYGSVLMCQCLLPHFKKNKYGKIVQISGGGATSPLPRFSAYAASKAAVIRFVETLAEEVREFNIYVNAIAPGALNTAMLDEVIQAGPSLVGEAFHQRALRQRNSGGVPLERGAALAVFLASEESDGITGKLISAVWDPWEDLAEFRDALADSDIYTLRRIIPADRGQTWGER